MAATLYRLLAGKIGQDHERQAPRTLFRKYVYATADVTIGESAITVHYRRRANNPYLIKSGFAEQRCRIPWLGNRVLRFTFGGRDR